jgi:5'-3' exonuclease
MVALIDLDSVLYESVYKIVSIREMREAIKKHGKESAKQWLMEEVYNEGINRCENQLLKMQNYLNDIFFEDITSYELFITTCSKSFRKELSQDYKANRKRNKYVWLLREHYRHNGAASDDVLEADDLIAKRANEIGIGENIIVSLDKDLKQIGGYYWSYYKVKSKDHEGNLIMNEFGFYEREYKQKEVTFISKKEAERLFWKQMLMGDTSDNIKGLHRVGDKTADKILTDAPILWRKVAREYITRKQKEDFKINYQLLKLG